MGNVYVAGATGLGIRDVFLHKYDAAGDLQWTRQLGTSGDDWGGSAAADGLGNVYISGSTDESLGGPNAGLSDAFVSKYDSSGNVQWTRQLGSTANDSGYDVSADSLGNVFIAGTTTGSLAAPIGPITTNANDAFVAKYDAAGNLQWTRQFNANPVDVSLGVAGDDAGNVYTTGYTGGSFKAFVNKYDSAGTLEWTTQYGIVSTQGWDVSADSLGNVYAAGDRFVNKYDAAGNYHWTYQPQSRVFSIEADGMGNLYLSGQGFLARYVIPEPASWLLVALAGVALVGIGARRKTGLAGHFPLLLCVITVLAVADRADAGTLYAATAGDHGELYILDHTTGAVLRNVGPLNDAAGRNYPMQGLAFQPHTRVLYGATHYSDSADPATVSKLVTIDPDTAEVTVVGSFFLGNPGTMTDLAFIKSGNLFGISSYGPPQIHYIDINTGITTPGGLIGNFPATVGGGIASMGGGSIFGGFADPVYFVTPTADELGVHGFACHPRFGCQFQYSKIANPDKPAGGGNYGALDFDGSVLYGLNVGPGSPPQTHLVTFNRSTGAVTDIGRSVDGLQAIAFVPEPGTLALSSIGMFVLVGWMGLRFSASQPTRIGTRSIVPVLVACAGLLLIEPASAVTIDWVTVGDPGNPANRYGQGDVPYVYRIGKYDVTVNQYVELLNRKDPTGANSLGLFGPEMSEATYGGISVSASAADGSKYEVIAGRGNHPVNYVSFFDAARFANWLNNGQGDGDTESGAYTLLGGTPIPSNSMEVTRNPGAQVFIPSQDEWIKAGHFLPGANIYFEYPTSSNTPPTSSPPTDVVNRANFLPNGPGNLTDVGAYTGTTSRYGAYDMAGNVVQWTDTCEGCSPDPFPKRNVKGISFRETDVSPASLSLFRAGNATGSQNDVGFRVGRSIPEPTTFALLGLAFVSMVSCAHRRRSNTAQIYEPKRGRCIASCVRLSAATLICSTLLFPMAALPAHAQTLEWVRQFALGPIGDSAADISTDDSGNVYIAGTYGILVPPPVGGGLMGNDNAFVRKYDAEGSLLWTRSRGTTTTQERGWGVSADGVGNVYFGWENALDKYDSEGNLQWSKQVEIGTGISADGLGSVYISGPASGAGSYEVFVHKFDAMGDLEWSKETETASRKLTFSGGVSADGIGNVYISGYTLGDLGGPNAGIADAFLSKYDAAGNLEWTRQLGTTEADESHAVSADSLGDVYISGQTGGNLGGALAGSSDVFVSKYDAAGSLHWTRQFGTEGVEQFTSVSTDGQESIYITGNTYGDLGGPHAGGGTDVFVSKFDAAGELKWTRQLGTSATDFVNAASADGLGNVFIAGRTDGSLAGPASLAGDAFVAKYSDSTGPEPIPGDYNGDGTVDAADYVLWRNTLGDTGTYLAADGNGNGQIDSGDYDVWRTHFGRSTIPANTPEPGSIALFITALVAAAMFDRKRSWDSLVARHQLRTRYLRGGVNSFKLLLCIIFAMFICARADAGILYAATAGAHGELYILDPATGGVLRDVGPLNDAAGRNYPVTGLAVHPATGALFGSTHDSPTGDPATISRLVSINAVTAEVTVIGEFNFGNAGTPATMTDLAFNRAGTLYGIGSVGNADIYPIDIYTADVLGGPLHPPTTVEGGGLAINWEFPDFPPSYYLTPTASQLSHWYLVPSGPRPGIYHETVGNPAKPAGGGNYGALDFDAGVLYGLNVGPGSPPPTHLVVINPGNAAVTDLGRSVDALEAIAFRPDYLPIPEPASWLLGALAGAGVLFISKRRRQTTDHPPQVRRDVLPYYSSTALFHLICVGSLFGVPVSQAHAQTEWIRQLDAANNKAHGLAVSADGLGSVYMAGVGGNAFVAKYDDTGDLQWTRYLGSGLDAPSGAEADGEGNVYISGTTYGSTGAGGDPNALINKYDAAGNLLWTHRFGSTEPDYSAGVSDDGVGSIYISGRTDGSLDGINAGGSDAFVRKYDAVGNLLWTRQLGTAAFDESSGVSADGLGNVYISGRTDGSFEGVSAGRSDAFVSKYDAAGNVQWTHQFGSTEEDYSRGASTDGLGNVYIAGWTRGNLARPSAGGIDAFLSKYDSTGALQWMRQFGTSADDIGQDVSADGLGNVYVSGYTGGSLGGPFRGEADAFLSKYDAAGNLIWITQLGTQQEDGSSGVSADGLGNIYISGETEGGLIGPVGAWADAFIAKYSESITPEPVPPVVRDARLRDQIRGQLITYQFATLQGTEPITWGSLVTNGPSAPTNAPTVTADGEFSWNTYATDSLGTYTFDVTASNAAGSDIGRLIVDLVPLVAPVVVDANLGNLIPGGLLTHQFGTSQGTPPITWGSLVANGPGALTNAPTLTANGAFRWHTAGSIRGTYTFDATASNAAGSDVGRLIVTLVPEPATISLVGIVMIGLLGFTVPRGSWAIKRSRSTIASPLTSTLLRGALLLVCATTDARAQTLEWVRPFGTTRDERSNGVSADGLGHVYVASFRSYQLPTDICVPGPLPGQSCIDQNAAITNFDAAGNLLWTQQLGTYSNDSALTVSADGLGNVYVAGDTIGSLGGPNAGNFDSFVSKYDAAGALQWTRQLGTSEQEKTSGVSADGFGNVYISGQTRGALGGPHEGGLYDSFLTKYDDDGNQQWIRQLPGSSDNVYSGVSADELGNVYLVGTEFVAKFDATGELQWTQPLLGRMGRSVSADGLGKVYVAGISPGGVLHDFVSKFAVDGSLEWTQYVSRQYADYGNVYGVSADGQGNVYMTGYDSSTGNFDAFIRKYDESGQFYWTSYLGGAGTLYGRAVSADGLGNIYVAGLSHVNYDDNEFVAKYIDFVTPVPGDYNGNGTVDAADYVVWRSTLGNTGTGLAADGNGNGQIDSGDYDMWRAHFGQSAASEAIPEPSSIALLASAVIVATFCRRKRHVRTCILHVFVGALTALAAATQLQAEIFDGQTVATRYIEFYAHGLPGPDATINSVVGPETELIGFFGLDVDFSDTNILITTRRDKFYLATLLFEDAHNSIPRFTGVTLNPATSWTGFTPSRISFDANRITIDLHEQTALADGEQISLDITAIVPEPATWLLATMCAILLAAQRKNWRSACDCDVATCNFTRRFLLVVVMCLAFASPAPGAIIHESAIFRPGGGAPQLIRDSIWVRALVWTASLRLSRSAAIFGLVASAPHQYSHPLFP